MTKHTELPKLAVGYINQGLGHGHYVILCEESGELFAKVPFGDKNLTTQVVRACNGFPELESVLLAIQAKVDSGEYLRVDDPEYQDLNAAISKAERTQP